MFIEENQKQNKKAERDGPANPYPLTRQVLGRFASGIRRADGPGQVTGDVGPARLDEVPKCPSAFQKISRPCLREREGAGGHSLWGGGHALGSERAGCAMRALRCFLIPPLRPIPSLRCHAGDRASLIPRSGERAYGLKSGSLPRTTEGASAEVLQILADDLGERGG